MLARTHTTSPSRSAVRSSTRLRPAPRWRYVPLTLPPSTSSHGSPSRSRVRRAARQTYSSGSGCRAMSLSSGRRPTVTRSPDSGTLAIRSASGPVTTTFAFGSSTARGLHSSSAGRKASMFARMAATIRLGTCSFADEGLVKAWYPRGVSTSKARLAYYAERFDTTEVDSPYYHLPDPAVTGRWAQRTPPEFVFHVKAHKTMTFHEGEPTDDAFAEFRSSIAPLELSGKLRGILLQYHPKFVKSPEALAELEQVRPRIEPLVPLVEFRHRSWMEPKERDDTLAFLERNGLAYVSLDTPMTRASNVVARHAAVTNPVAYVRFHGRNEKTWNIKAEKSSERFNWMYGPEELGEWVEKLGRLAGEADEVYAMFNNNRDDFAPRSAVLLRGLLDEAGIPAAGGIEPPPRTPTLF